MLEDAGATPTTVAESLPGLGSADLALPPRWAPALDHVRIALARQVAELLAHDPGTRFGEDPEELHQLRVATRRLRAILRAARDLLDPEWSEPLRAELSWLGSALGPARDFDVLMERLRVEIDGLEPSERRPADGSSSFWTRIGTRRARTMLEAMSEPRYHELLDRLGRPRRSACARGRSLASRLATAEFRKLRKAVKALPPDPHDDELHASASAASAHAMPPSWRKGRGQAGAALRESEALFRT